MADTSGKVPPAISVEGLWYSYKKTQALRGASFSVAQGSIHGFVGPNGAGKTTTLKILATLLKPQAGTALIFGWDGIRQYKQVRRRIGYMPDHLGLYRQMTVFECLDFFAAAYGLSLARRDSVIEDVLTLVDMKAHKDNLVSSLSRGMAQRVSLARALVHDPELLLLDEPASGLDPRARIELIEILRELRRMGKTVFISSHILSELADLCDSVTIIDRGLVRYSGTMGALLSRWGEASAYVLTLRADSPAVEQALRGLAGISEVTKLEGQPSYRLLYDAQKTDANAVLRAVLESGGTVASFHEDARQLSHVFMELTEPGVS